MAPAVLAISSHVARGAVGNRAITSACEALGLSVWAVNTVSLPFHPGHGHSTRIEPDPEQFESYLQDLLKSPWVAELGGVLTGYMASADQARAVGRFLEELRKRNPGIVHLCDPVIGDAGGLYVGEDVAAAIGEDVLSGADIATPNRHELAWLVDQADSDDPLAIAAMARRLGPPSVIVTSAPAMMRGHLANLLVEGDAVLMAEHQQIGGPPNGPGDLIAGLLMAHLMLGEALPKALEKAVASVLEIVSLSARNGSDEMLLAQGLNSMVRPMAAINLRRIVTPQTAK